MIVQFVSATNWTKKHPNFC